MAPAVNFGFGPLMVPRIHIPMRKDLQVTDRNNIRRHSPENSQLDPSNHPFCQFFDKNWQFWQIFFFKNHLLKCPLTNTFLHQWSLLACPMMDFLMDVLFCPFLVIRRRRFWRILLFWFFFCCLSTKFLTDFAILVCFLLSVDELSNRDCYFGPFVLSLGPWWTERRIMQMKLASVHHVIHQQIADRSRMTETCSISVVLSAYG